MNRKDLPAFNRKLKALLVEFMVNAEEPSGDELAVLSTALFPHSRRPKAKFKPSPGLS